MNDFENAMRNVIVEVTERRDKLNELLENLEYLLNNERGQTPKPAPPIDVDGKQHELSTKTHDYAEAARQLDAKILERDKERAAQVAVILPAPDGEYGNATMKPDRKA